ncbi:MAG: calcium-binding protein [Niveispirillum sp.]|uniref:hypothetical protein n=1 Tax=Niveispirillum sp. TaxID=1917217 RepID=UPI0006B8D4CC
MAKYDWIGEAVVNSITQVLVPSVVDLLADLGRDAVDAVRGLNLQPIPGSIFADKLSGTAGNDLFVTGAGADTIRAGAGTDVIIAGKGDDVIDGGAGSDVMSGGSGNDRFVFTSTALVAGDQDLLVDAKVGERLDFDAASESLLRIGGVALSALTATTAVPTFLQAGVTNVAQIDGHLVIDLNNDGRYDAASDYKIIIPDGLSLRYDAGADWFVIG